MIQNDRAGLILSILESKWRKRKRKNSPLSKYSWMIHEYFKLPWNCIFWHTAKNKWKLKAKQIPWKEKLIRLINLKPSFERKSVTFQGTLVSKVCVWGKRIIKCHMPFRKFRSHHSSDTNISLSNYFCNFVKEAFCIENIYFLTSFFSVFSSSWCFPSLLF